MYGHGGVGRTFAGRVTSCHRFHRDRRLRVGVTLFAVHPDDLKQCVYTMRFDGHQPGMPSSAPS